MKAVMSFPEASLSAAQRWLVLAFPVTVNNVVIAHSRDIPTVGMLLEIDSYALEKGIYSNIIG